MKVHIAYDDGELIGVYRKRKDAKEALAVNERTEWIASGCQTSDIAGWVKHVKGIERSITWDGSTRWTQWIDTYEVKGTKN